jgi:hypothetical protein
MTMANEQNLKPITNSDMARQLQEKSVQKRHENTIRRKTLAEELLALLSVGETQKKMSLSLIEKAMQGDTKAFEVIRDSIGEKQTEKVESNGTQNVVITMQGDVSEWGK